ncbi:unnamed protein product [Chrysodeixis includens]|uniref:Sorting nexin-14-like n=1 Tax=Chrysodeixis includens TaxID=689277 RepID=A0A9N8KT15_CHRIL|nr:unnamed protein product [Chrysodeixis includens]
MSERCQTKLTEKFDNKNYIIYFGIICTSIAVLYFYRFHFATIAFSYVLGCLACYYGLNSNILHDYIDKLKCHFVGETYKDEADPPVKGCETCGSKDCERHDSSVSEPWVGLQIHKQLDQAIEDFYNTILEQFISSWYSKITLQPFFVDELRHQLRYASACLLQRAVKINYGRFLLTRLVPCVLRHCAAWSVSRTPHPAAANRRAELRYLRCLTTALMPHLLKPNDLSNDVFRVLIREIFAGWVLLSLTDVLAEPYILNTLIILATGDETMAQLPSTPNYKVEFLETFARQTESIYTQRCKLLRVELDLVISEQEHFYAFMQYMKTTSHIHLLQFYNDIKSFQTKILKPELSELEQDSVTREALVLSASYRRLPLPAGGQLAAELDAVLLSRHTISKLQTSRALYEAARQSHALLEKLWLPKFLHSEEFYKLLIGSRIPTGYQKQMVKKPHDKLLNTALKLGHRLKGALKTQTVDGQVLDCFTNCEESEGDGVDNMDILNYLDNLAVEESLRGHDLGTYKVVLTNVETKMQAPPRRGSVRVFTLAVHRAVAGAAAGLCSVDRSEHDFHLLRAKLHEFHGDRLLHDLTLPSRRILHNTPQHYSTLHNTTEHYTTPHNSTQHYTTLHNTTQLYTTLHNSTQHYTTLHNTTQHYTTLHNSTQHYTTLHNTTQHYTTLHNTTQHYTTLHNTTQLYTTLHNSTQHYTTLHNTTQLYTTLHNSTQHYTILHNTTQHHTTQHYTTLHNTTQLYTTLHNTTQLYTTLHNTTQHYTTLHNTTQHYTTLHNTTQLYTTLHNSTQHYTTLHNSTQHYTTLHNTTQHYTLLHNTTQLYTTLHNSTQHYTTLHNTTHYYTTLHNTTQHYTLLHNTTQHYTTLHNTTQHYTLHNTTQLYTTLHNSTQHYTTLHNTTQLYTTLHNSTQHYTLLHNTTRHHTTLHNSTQHYTLLHNTTRHHTTLHNSTQHYTTLHNSTQLYTTLHITTPHYTTLHNTTQYYTTLHNTTHYYTTLHNSTQHYTTLHNTTQLYTTLHITTQHYTTLHNSTQHYTTLHNTTQLYTTLHNTTQLYTTLHNTTQLYTTLHNSTQHYTTLHNTTQLYTTLHNSTQHYTTLHNTTQLYTTLHNTTQHYTTLHNTTQLYTTLHDTTQHYTTLHNTTHYYTTLHITTQHYTTPHNTTQLYTTLHITTPHYTTPHYTTLHNTSFTVIRLQLDNSPLETLRYKYEDFLQRLLQKSLLQTSELLRIFLTEDGDFSLVVQASALNATSTDLANIYQTVAHRLKKEKGQHLESFLRNLLVSSDIERYQALKQGARDIEEGVEMSEEIQEEQHSKRQRRVRNILASVFDNNFGVEPLVGAADRDYQNCVVGFTQCFMYLLIKVVRVRSVVWSVIGSVASLLRPLLDQAAETMLNGTLKNLLTERRLAHLIRLGHGVLFGRRSSGRNELSRQRAVARRQLISRLPALTPGALPAALLRAFDAIQSPQHNKQLVYNLLDLCIMELFPELNIVENIQSKVPKS